MNFISAEIKYYAEIVELNNTYYEEVNSLDIRDFNYQEGMISVGFLTAFRTKHKGEIITGIINPVTKRYYFGEFLSLNNLIKNNVNHEYDDMIQKIKDRQLLGVVGYVKDTNGNYHMVLKQDMVIPKNNKIKTR